jgi:hypothetical protein
MVTSEFRDDDLDVGDPTATLAYHAWVAGNDYLDRINVALSATGTDDVVQAARHALSSLIDIDAIRALHEANNGFYDQLLALPADNDAERARVATEIAENTQTIAKRFENGAHAAAIATTPDVEPMISPEAPLPETKDWATTAARVRADTLAWLAAHPEPKRDMLILKPSPSTGKTESMIAAALATIVNQKQVVFAVRTKEMLETELTTRLDDAAKKHPVLRGTSVHLRVITGRDKDNCNFIENVEMVQAHGYSPGHTVCAECPYHPKFAYAAHMEPCAYYQQRIAAHQHTRLVGKVYRYHPLILTTQASLSAVAEHGGGKYGSFWNADLALIDEDLTDAFESVTELGRAHLDFDATGNEVHQPAADFAELMRHVINLADAERKTLKRRGYFVDPRDERKGKSETHTPYGSTIAGRDLHRLLAQALAAHPQTRPDGTTKILASIISAAADLTPKPGPGELFGLNSTSDVNEHVPHHGIARLADVLATEMRHARERGLHLVQQATGKPVTDLIVEHVRRGEILDIEDAIHMYAGPDWDNCYQARLSCGADDAWHFAVHEFSNLDNLDSNIIYGDAYAQIDHIRSLLNKPAPTDGSPDPVTIIEHVAHFPTGSVLWRFPTQSNIGHLDGQGYWGEHCDDLLEVLTALAGRRVLIYGHSALRERFEAFMAKNSAFGIEEWAWEHWWGGRGKDQYKNFDAVVAISEPVMNVGGTFNIVNARAFRDVQRMPGTANVQHMLPRIRPSADKRHGIAAMMRDARTHERVRHEHERQNVNEHAQALHRVRPLMADRIMITMSSQIELTRDVIAASSTASRPLSDRGRLTEGHLSAFFTAEEMLAAMLAVEEYYGVWSPLFCHALTSVTLDRLIFGDNGPHTENLSGTERAPSSINNSPQDRAIHWSSRLVDRVWEPQGYWEDRTRRLREHKAYKRASQMLNAELMKHEPIQVPWTLKDQKQRGRYGVWSRNGDAVVVRKAFMDIASDRYGATINGVVQAPRKLGRVPF